MRKTISYFLLSFILVLVIVGCFEDNPLPEPKIVINDGKEIFIDADKLDSLFIPIAVTSEDYLYNLKIYAMDLGGNENIVKNYFFDSLIRDFSDTCYYKDFIKTDFPEINHFSYLGAVATTDRHISKMEYRSFSFANFGTPISEEVPFTWTRIGIDDGDGLSIFGLAWDNTVGDDFAVIRKNQAEKMVQLNFNQWSAITNEEQLIEIIEAGTDLTGFNGISTIASAKYDVVLGVVYNAEYFMLHITQAIVEEEIIGKTVTITGFYKKTQY